VRKVPEDKPTTATKWLLIVVGLALIGLSAFAVYAGHRWGNETKETSTPGSSSATGASGASGATGATGTTGAAGATTTTKITTTKNFGSDSLLTAGFATGAALVALGLLYPRLRTLKLPGGVELGFVDTDKEEAKKIGDNVDKKVEAGEITEEDAPAVKQRAATIARAQKVEQLQSGSGWGSAPTTMGWGSSASAAPSSSSSNWLSSSPGWGGAGPKLSDEELAQSVEAAMAVGRSD
jgi:hypothetical protein